jgi:hypothetical protein
LTPYRLALRHGKLLKENPGTFISWTVLKKGHFFKWKTGFKRLLENFVPGGNEVVYKIVFPDTEI